MVRPGRETREFAATFSASSGALPRLSELDGLMLSLRMGVLDDHGFALQPADFTAPQREVAALEPTLLSQAQPLLILSRVCLPTLLLLLLTQLILLLTQLMQPPLLQPTLLLELAFAKLASHLSQILEVTQLLLILEGLLCSSLSLISCTIC